MHNMYMYNHKEMILKNSCYCVHTVTKYSTKLFQGEDSAPTVSVAARPGEETGAFRNTDPYPPVLLERPGTGADAAVCWCQSLKVLSEGQSSTTMIKEWLQTILFPKLYK